MRDKYWISVGESRRSTKWRKEQVTWEQFCARVNSLTRTQETYAEYIAMDKTHQDAIKDIGGFVAGTLNGPRRSAQSIKTRSMITLDADYAPPGLMDELEFVLGYAAVMYTTHKHCPEKPRFRLIIPLARDVTPEEYEAVSRMVAKDLGMDSFDDTTYQPSRLMYWPSCSRDAEYIYRKVDGDLLDPAEVLGRYHDWRDITAWPVSSRVAAITQRSANKQQNPREKDGVIGAFCRTYDIHDAIAKFLSDVYTQCENDPNRYTYCGGSTANGLVLYQDAAFAYSNHSTDPAGGQLCNSFDLVRLHWYGDKDSKTPSDTPIHKKPSYKAMVELANSDELVRKCVTMEKLEGAKSKFDDVDIEEEIEPFEMTKDGKIKNSIHNVITALKSNDAFKGVRKNFLSNNIEISTKLPWGKAKGAWNDADDVQLRAYLERIAEFGSTKIMDGVIKYSEDRGYHPIKDYFENLPVWDGEPRAETYFVDTLGAEDSPYTRTITRKHLCAAMRRIYEPGCKYDTMLVLNGPQGKGKSTAIAKLAVRWFSDAVKLSDMASKAAAEKLLGAWLCEVAELAGMRNVETEMIKSFISAQVDTYRPAYGHHTVHQPRQCVFFGTTNNEDGYLRDRTGNRRFWDLKITGHGKKFKSWDVPSDYIDQIWAEVKTYYKEEDYNLPDDIAKEAEEKQREALESDPRQGMVEEFLDELLPTDWYSMSLDQRARHHRADYTVRENDTMQRNGVCVAEIWHECFGQPVGKATTSDSKSITVLLKKLKGWVAIERTMRVPGYGPTRVFARKGCEHMTKAELFPKDIGGRFNE